MSSAAPFVYETKRGLVRVYTCSNCGQRFEWAYGKCSWFGSIKDMEDRRFDRIMFACSHACAEKLRTETEGKKHGFHRTR